MDNPTNYESEQQNVPPMIPPSMPVLPANPPKKRRWWFYVFIALVCMMCLSAITVVSVVGVWFYAVRTYTSPQPRPMPQQVVAVATNTIEVASLSETTTPPPQDQPRGRNRGKNRPQRATTGPQKTVQDVVERWMVFYKAVMAREHPAPFVLTITELNAFLAQDSKNDRNQIACIETNGTGLRLDFALPLSQMTGNKMLTGRYFNGSADLGLNMDDGFLNLNALALEANGNKVPKWIMSRVKKKNILTELENNYDLVEFLQELESLEVKDGGIVATPMPKR